MKKNKLILLLVGIMSLASCNENNSDSSESTISDSSVSDEEKSEQSTSGSESSETGGYKYVDTEDDLLFAESYKDVIMLSSIKKEDKSYGYDDDSFGYFGSENIKYSTLYCNNLVDNSKKYGKLTDEDDAKYLFYNDNEARFVNVSDGYALTIPSDRTFVGDFSLSASSAKIYNDISTITISKETSNPYNSWYTYYDEWVVRYLFNEEYLSDNDMSYLEKYIDESLDILDGYVVSIVSLVINNPNKLRKNYYNIAIIRDKEDLKGKEFYQVIMKSTMDRTADFKKMIGSFELTLAQKGISKNQYDNMEVYSNPNWNEETKNYYDLLCSQNRTDWGFYVANLDSSPLTKLSAYERAVDYDFEVLPTYQHCAWGKKTSEFDLEEAISYCGGNGFNNKKVLHYTYQYTTNNNNVSQSNTTDCYTPMFDILRGDDGSDPLFGNSMGTKLENTFYSLAESIKEYGHPVLFRLNNEMNTDWTSYCGLMCLNDPDIYKATWRKLYYIFEEVGVDNAIWIFNPQYKSIPYSSWGDAMNYFPGYGMVNVLGLTYYEANNGTTAWEYVNKETFKDDYKAYYDEFNGVWKNYPWVISEFGCGAGGATSGERYRNQASQVEYVNGMFEDFNDRENNPYLANIKIAIWFSVNDYSGSAVSNQYDVSINYLPNTIAAFKEGLAKNKKN